MSVVVKFEEFDDEFDDEFEEEFDDPLPSVGVLPFDIVSITGVYTTLILVSSYLMLIKFPALSFTACDTALTSLSM